MFSIAVKCEAGANIKTRLTARNQKEDSTRRDPPQQLGKDIAQNFLAGKTTRSPETDRHSRIEMTARDVANRKSHGQHRQAKCD